MKEDPSGSWLLQVELTNFQFAPEKAGEKPTNVNEGHAHICIDGEKLNRLYGEYYNLDELDRGNHTVKVALYANNHQPLTYNQKEIAFKETIKVE
ncbi:hypothetical protein [Halobacillus seohaensis]|uniref:DUF4399 domain-containing protein n=1 Tax=Halobacillus seohaensis TaxID=447421 RepID=A0ABW2ETH9_9BACI